MLTFNLPAVVRELAIARNRLRDHYGSAGLNFMLDGNLVGDIGEAVAAELFGIELLKRNGTGIDGRAPDGRTVQVKASGCGRGPAFRMVETRADHLLFFHLDFDECTGLIVFNGPEKVALSFLPDRWTDQRSLTALQIKRADLSVAPGDRLERLGSAATPRV